MGEKSCFISFVQDEGRTSCTSRIMGNMSRAKEQRDFMKPGRWFAITQGEAAGGPCPGGDKMLLDMKPLKTMMMEGDRSSARTINKTV